MRGFYFLDSIVQLSIVAVYGGVAVCRVARNRPEGSGWIFVFTRHVPNECAERSTINRKSYNTVILK